MKTMYTVAGISKQALWKYNKRQEEVGRITGQVTEIMHQLRTRHKRMGCRRMYYAMRKPVPVGRDLFEQIGFANGFKLRQKRNVMKTTWAQRVEVYPNLRQEKCSTPSTRRGSRISSI